MLLAVVETQREELLNNNIKNIRPIRYYQKIVSAVDVDHGRDGMLEGSVNVRLSLCILTYRI